MNNSYTEEILKRIPLPLAICDGGEPMILEELFMEFLKKNDIPYTLESGLYEKKDYDLSIYRTIAFSTMSSSSYLTTKMEKIFSFDKSNLKMIIALNSRSMEKVRYLAEKLNIECVGYLTEKLKFAPSAEIPEQKHW